VEMMDYQTIDVSLQDNGVLLIKINRPLKGNSMNSEFWLEIQNVFEQASENGLVRAIVLAGEGNHFSTGLDLKLWAKLKDDIKEEPCIARKSMALRKSAKKLQDAFNAIEDCRQPVIAAVHSSCIGGAVDMICACDIRYCSKDSIFSIKEVQLGLAADVGTLQRLPKIIGNHSLARELAYTGRNFNAEEALQLGLVSKILEDKGTVLAEALRIADDIASQSPVAIYGTKVSLLYSQDHSVRDGLEYIATWNGAALQTEDIPEVMEAKRQQRKPIFSKL